MSEWLYDKIQRVPEISNDQIASMRHIEPVLRIGETWMFRRIAGIENIDPRNESFLWDAKPTGREFTFHQLNMSVIITQHHSSVFFKPSLAEVYAWILFYMPDSWSRVSHFCLCEPQRIDGSSAFMFKCVVMGGKPLVRGQEFLSENGSIGHRLVPVSSP